MINVNKVERVPQHAWCKRELANAERERERERERVWTRRECCGTSTVLTSIQTNAGGITEVYYH